MNLVSYELDVKSNFLSFEFYSNGPKGPIRKIIQFKKLITADAQRSIYNLAFGDAGKDGKLDDLVVTNNEDSEKVLMTVAKAVISFTNQYPEAFVFAQGSTTSRMRYYMIGISKNYHEIFESFQIWGALSDEEWELFRKNRPYKALLAKRK